MIIPHASRASTEGGHDAQTRRFRLGGRLCVCALSLYMLLSATAVAQSGLPSTAADATSHPVRSDPQARVLRWWQSIGWGVLLLIILVASASAIIVFSRRFRKYLQPESKEPTPSDDAWTMHKLTDSADPVHENGEEEDTDTPPA